MVVIMVSAPLENLRKVGTLSQNLEEYIESEKLVRGGACV